MKREWKPVQPTPFYLSMRAEWFRREADKALHKGEIINSAYLLKRAQEYATLAGELPIGDTDAQAS